MLCFIPLLQHRPVRYKFPTRHGRPGQEPARCGSGVLSGLGLMLGGCARNAEPRAVPRSGPGSRTARSVRPELSLPTMTPLSTYLHAHAKLYKQQ